MIQPLSDAVVSQAAVYRARGWSWEATAKELGVTRERLRRALDDDYRRRQNARKHLRDRGERLFRAPQEPRPLTRAELRKRKAQTPEDGRSLTGRLFGDPLPGRSALDRRRETVVPTSVTSV